MQKRNRGFSLLELMIVIVILGILASFVAPKLMDRPDEARVTKAMLDMEQLGTALKFYRLDNGKYPTTEQGLAALISKPTSGPEPRNWRDSGYIDGKNTPKDPWGNEFIYRSPGAGDRDFEIISLGADGEEGGESFDKDIHNWQDE